MKNKILILVLPMILCFLYACANTNSIQVIHPMEVRGIPDCNECHTDSYALLNHKSSDFFKKHGFYASNSRLACSSCHSEGFCSDCHAHKEEIKPADKFADSPDRMLPHRGDYLSQHKIDGKIDPSSCVKCHGRQNNQRCVSCHK